MATASELFERIGQKLSARSELVSSIGAVYKFALEGEGGGTWLVDLKTGPSVKPGDGPAACTVRMASTDFVDLFEGRANAQVLFFTGKLKVEGDMTLALKLESITSILK